MDQPTEAEDLVFECKDGIGRITFNRPQARNAFTFAMYERLAAICEQANDDRSIKVLVLRGAGDKAFASGTDINQFREFKTPQDAIDYENRIDRVLTTLEQCRVPTIAASRSYMAKVKALRACGRLKVIRPMPSLHSKTRSSASAARSISSYPLVFYIFECKIWD